jgi:curved DNA-binding protein
LAGGEIVDYKDYYVTLGIDKSASADDIQKAYRKLARKFHPDVNSNPGAEDRFKEITEAYEVLKDPEKRKTYDQFGADWKQAGRAGAPPPGWQGFDFGQGGAGASGFSSFFEMLFGQGRQGGGGGGRNPFAGGDFGGFNAGGFNPGAFGGGMPGAGRDQEMTLALTLEEGAEGGQREVTFTDPATRQTRTVNFNLPAGVIPGRKLKLAGRGGQGTNGQNGDLYLKIDFKPHPRFRLEGLDLHTDLPITPWQAALGDDATVRTLTGSIKVKVPAGSSTGRRIRLRGKGYPDGRGGFGDLYAEIKVMVPEQLTDRERELFEELAQVSEFKPR